MSRLKLNKKKLKFFIIFLAVFLIVFSLSVIVYMNSKIIVVVYVPYDFKIKGQNHLGFNAGRDALHFGIIAPGTAGIRELELQTDKTALVKIKVINHDFISPNKNEFILEAGNLTYVQFTANPPSDYPQGNYTGRVRIVFKKP